MLCVCEWDNEGLSFARKMGVLVFMVGEVRRGEKGVPNLKRCENATIRAISSIPKRGKMGTKKFPFVLKIGLDITSCM